MRAYSYARNRRPAAGIKNLAAVVHDKIVAFSASQAGEIMMKMAVEKSRFMRVFLLLHSRAVEDCHFFALYQVVPRFTSVRHRR